MSKGSCSVKKSTNDVRGVDNELWKTLSGHHVRFDQFVVGVWKARDVYILTLHISCQCLVSFAEQR